MISDELKRKSKVLTWGFPEAALRDWPEDLEPFPVTELPVPQLVVVYASAREKYETSVLEAESREQVAQSAALFCPVGEPIPDDGWEYYDMVVMAGDWDALREAYECTHQYDAAGWASDIPVEKWAEGATDPAAETILNEAADYLDADSHEHLRDCDKCREIFMKRLQQEINEYRRLFCPPMRRLARLLDRKKDDAWVAVHYPKCIACQGRLEGYEQHVLPYLIPTITLPLPNLEQPHSGPASSKRKPAEALERLYNSLISTIGDKATSVSQAVAPFFAMMVLQEELIPVSVGSSLMPRNRDDAAESVISEEDLTRAFDRLMRGKLLSLRIEIRGVPYLLGMRLSHDDSGVTITMMDAQFNPIGFTILVDDPQEEKRSDNSNEQAVLVPLSLLHQASLQESNLTIRLQPPATV